MTWWSPPGTMVRDGIPVTAGGLNRSAEDADGRHRCQPLTTATLVVKKSPT
jgi:hypothetical protein